MKLKADEEVTKLKIRMENTISDLTSLKGDLYREQVQKTQLEKHIADQRDCKSALAQQVVAIQSELKLKVDESRSNSCTGCLLLNQSLSKGNIP